MFFELLTITLVLILVWYIVTKAIPKQIGNISILDFFRMILFFRGVDFVNFKKKHDKYFEEAKKTGDHTNAVENFYSVMADLIEKFYGKSFHFAAPEDDKQDNNEALAALHKKLGNLLGLAPGKKVLDLGCGIGDLARDYVLNTGCKASGITLSSDETRIGNEKNKECGLGHMIDIHYGDMQDLKDFKDGEFDAVSGVYCLKYLPTLDRVCKEVNRVLKPGGKFLVYCMIKTPKYDPKVKEHKNLIENFEYSCGMPSLHTHDETIEECKKFGMEIISDVELSQNGRNWYNVFEKNKLVSALRIKPIYSIIQVLENLRVFPQGFNNFVKTFIRGNVCNIVDSAKMGILSGSNVLIFQKKN